MSIFLDPDDVAILTGKKTLAEIKENEKPFIYTVPFDGEVEKLAKKWLKDFGYTYGDVRQ